MVGMLLKILDGHICHRLTRKTCCLELDYLTQPFPADISHQGAAKFALRKEYGLTECSNPLLALPVDLYRYVLL